MKNLQKLSLSGLFYLFFLILVWSQFKRVAVAQIIPDHTLGEQGSVVNRNLNIRGSLGERIDGGAIRGGNLFHSFREFNVGDGQRVYFSNPTGIENILSRVTGENISNILGTLGVLGNANLFLINPNGIYLGPNARLDVGGSFFASTADSLIFDNGFEFSATSPQTPPLLTINIPLGLRFRENPGDILVQQASLGVPNRQSLGLIGGNINIEGGLLQSLDGRVELGGLSTPGTVEITSMGLIFPTPVSRSNLSLTDDTTVEVTQTAQGNIAIHTNNLILSNSNLNGGIERNLTASEGQPGSINIDATGVMTLSNSIISNRVNEGGIGNSGLIQLRANTVNLINSALDSRVVGSGANQEKIPAQGNAGNIILDVGGPIILDGSFLNTNIGSDVTGNSGLIEITAESLTLRNDSGLNSINSGEGNSGDIAVTIWGGSLSLSQGSEFDSRVPKSEEERVGNAGNIQINAERAIINLNQGFLVTTVGDNVIGNSGNVTIRGAFLSLTNGGRIAADTSGGTTSQPSQAGNITLNIRDRITIDGIDQISIIDTVTPPKSSGVFSQVTNKGIGRGGDLNIQARELSLTNGGQLRVDTYGLGDTGNVTINIEDGVNISGIFDHGENPAKLSGIFSRVNRGAVGNGNPIQIQAGSLVIQDGVIDSRVIGVGPQQDQIAGQGNAGSVTLEIDGITRLLEKAYINTNIGGGVIGNSGQINIQSGSLLMQDGAQLNTNTSGGNFEQPSIAGDVILNLDNGIVLVGRDGVGFDFQTRISTEVGNEAVGDAGAIKIEVTDGSLTLTEKAAFVTRVRREDIDDNGQLRLAGQGNGGDVTLNVSDQAIFEGDSVILTTVGDEVLGTRSGDVNITAESVTIQDNAQIITATGGSQNALETPSVAGNISIQVRDGFEVSQSQILSSATAKATQADGGSINITAASISIDDQARITAGDGTLDPAEQNSAGQINLNAANIRLNQGTLEADSQRDRTETASITVNSPDLRLRQQSNFTTNANNTTGGNITIHAETLVGLDNSDITANADGGAGGVIEITAEGVFGSTPLTRQQVEERLGEEQIEGNPRFSQDLLQNSSDIVAISTTDAALSGDVNLNTEIDPARGLIDVSQTFVDPAALIAQDPCKLGQDSEFIITGRGGLAVTPNDRFDGSQVQVNLVEPILPNNSRSTTSKSQPQTQNNSSRNSVRTIIPARGWIRNQNGDVILVSYDPTQRGVQRQPYNFNQCQPSSNLPE